LAFQQPTKGFVQAPTFTQIQGGGLVPISGYNGPNGVIIPNVPIGGQANNWNPLFQTGQNPFGNFQTTADPINLNPQNTAAASTVTPNTYRYVAIFSSSVYLSVLIVLSCFCGLFVGISTYLIWQEFRTTESKQNSSLYSANPNNTKLPPLATGL